MGDFSQWSLSIEGIPVERSDNTGTAMLFESFLLEQKGRVQQPPKCERTLAAPSETRGKIEPSEKIATESLRDKLLNLDK